MAESKEKYWKPVHGWVLAGLTIAVGFVVWLGIAQLGMIIPTWLGVMGLMLLFLIVAGHGTNGKWPWGWLINEQNRMSLSRLQIALWTVLIFSAWVAAAGANLLANLPNPLKIAIPSEIWIALGISTTSLVTAGLITADNQNKRPNKEANEKGLKQALGETGFNTLVTSYKPKRRTGSTLNDVKKEEGDAALTKDYTDGSLARNKTPAEANLGDLIRGDQLLNRGVVDLSRVQNLFITFVLVGAYAATLGRVMTSAAAKAITDFPLLDASMIALLTISHAGYLAGKAVPKQKEGAETPPDLPPPPPPGGSSATNPGNSGTTEPELQKENGNEAQH